MEIPVNFHSKSSSAMKSILGLHFPSGTILDVNYGLGVFYKEVTRNVVGIDILPKGDILADNRSLPFSDNSFSVGVCDPPYKRGNGDQFYKSRYGVAPYTYRTVTQQYLDLLPELLRVSSDGIIIKAQDETDGHRFYSRGLELMNFMLKLTGLEPHDITYVVREGMRENTISGRTRHFLANGVSYFLIYKWKAKYKPYRY